MYITLSVASKPTAYDRSLWLPLYYVYWYGLTTLNNEKSGQVSTNNGIIMQNIFNDSVLTSVELKKIKSRL